LKSVEYYFNKTFDSWNLFKIVVNENNLSDMKNDKEELFENFIYKFLKNKSFRNERTIIPYKVNVTEVTGGNKTRIISQSDMHYYFQDFHKVFIVYDNFDKERPSLEMVNLCSTGNMNGINYGYIFKLKNGKWYLESGWDCSN
jgi:hypothetical protein